MLTWIACGSVLTGPVSAEFNLGDVKISGFGSVVGGQTLDSNETLYGYDNDFSMHPESRFALQFIAPISEKFKATAQIMARGKDDYTPSFEWAFITYKATDDLSFMAGRQRFQLFKYSDYVEVGYAYLWIRPPRGVYDIQFNSGDGVGVHYRTHFGEVDTNFTYKIISIDIPDFVPQGTNLTPGHYEINNANLFNADLTWDYLNFGINLIYIPKLSYDSPLIAPVADAVRQFGYSESTVQDILAREDPVKVYGAYIGYDPGDWFVLAEYTSVQLDPSAFADQDSYYLSAGFRWDKLTFHTTYGADENTASSNADQVIRPSDVLPGGLPLKTAVSQAVNAQVSESDYYSFGVRWDVETQVAIKLEFTNFNDKKFDAKDAKLISTSIDFVF